MNVKIKELRMDENKSSSMRVAIKYPKCPIGEICFYIVTRFGNIINECPYFEDNGTAQCNYKEGDNV